MYIKLRFRMWSLVCSLYCFLLCLLFWLYVLSVTLTQDLQRERPPSGLLLSRLNWESSCGIPLDTQEGFVHIFIENISLYFFYEI